MRHVEHGTARLATTDEGAGPPLVALHAGVADSRVWHHVRDTWTAEGWRVVTHDRRGFGASTWQPEPFSHIDDLLAVMDDVGIDAAVMVGNSQGGRVAIDTALDHPDRVIALVLVAAAVTGRPLDPDRFGPDERALDAAVDAAAEHGDLDEANRLEAHLWLDGPRQAEGRVTGADRELFLDMNGRALHAPPTGEARWGPSAWDRLADIAVPTLVVVGDLDLAPDAFAELADAIPGAGLVRMPGSAHLPMLDDPVGFCEVVRPFLSAHR